LCPVVLKKGFGRSTSFGRDEGGGELPSLLSRSRKETRRSSCSIWFTSMLWEKGDLTCSSCGRSVSRVEGGGTDYLLSEGKTHIDRSLKNCPVVLHCPPIRRRGKKKKRRVLVPRPRHRFGGNTGPSPILIDKRKKKKKGGKKKGPSIIPQDGIQKSGITHCPYFLRAWSKKKKGELTILRWTSLQRTAGQAPKARRGPSSRKTLPITQARRGGKRRNIERRLISPSSEGR